MKGISLILIISIFVTCRMSFAQESPDSLLGVIKVRKVEVKMDYQEKVLETQVKDSEDDGRSSYVFIINETELPEYPGGQAAFLDYIERKMRYPRVARKNGMYARYDIEFTADSIVVMKDMGKICGCDELKTVSMFVPEEILNRSFTAMCNNANRTVRKALKKFSPNPDRQGMIYVATVNYKIPPGWKGVAKNGRIVAE